MKTSKGRDDDFETIRRAGGGAMMKSVSGPTLTEQAIAGDAAAFGQLLQSHDDAMRAVAYKMLGSQAAMDDALQAAYLKAFRKIGEFRADASFGTWLNRIVVNCCYDQLRAVGRRHEVPLDDMGTAANFSSHEDRFVESQQLHSALQALSADRRAAVLLVDGEGLSYNETAEILGIERGTVASRLNRARAELRRQLGMNEETNL